MIGGTWLWRDQRRLGLTLAEIWMHDDFRVKAMNQLVKSSLPWFKSLAIREVDALVHQDDSTNFLTFPYNPILANWITPFLERNDFFDEGVYSQVLIHLKDRPQTTSHLTIDDIPNIEWVRNTLWEQRENLGLDISPPGMMVEYANELESLMTFSNNGNTLLALTRYTIGDTVVMGPLIYDSSLDPSSIVSSIFCILPNDSSRIFLSLISKSQEEILKALEEFGQPKVSEMRLLRRTY
jgi:hypothetical protein